MRIINLKSCTPEENQSVNDIVDRVVEEAVESFKPLYDHLMSQIAKQKAIIEQLQESLALGAQEQGQEQGHEENAPQGEDDDGEPAQPQVSRIPQTKAKARIAGQVVAPTITNGKVSPPSVEWVVKTASLEKRVLSQLTTSLPWPMVWHSRRVVLRRECGLSMTKSHGRRWLSNTTTVSRRGRSGGVSIRKLFGR